MATTDLLSVSMNFPNLDIHRMESYNMRAFVTGVILIEAVACIRTLFLFMAEKYSIVYIYSKIYKHLLYPFIYPQTLRFFP